MRLAHVAVVGALALASACSTAQPDHPMHPSPTMSAEAPEPVVYMTDRSAGALGQGILIERPADAAKLRGAPADFKAFIGAEFTRFAARMKAAGCPVVGTEGSAIAVFGVASDVATGNWGCGDGMEDVLWVKRNQHWRQGAEGGAYGYTCAELLRFRVPAVMAPATCWTDTNYTHEVPYEGPTG